MSRLDEYENSRGPVRRRKNRAQYPRNQRPAKREVQLQMKLLGGTTAKDKGEPFDDDIGHIG
jgi:hypothetical protein